VTLALCEDLCGCRGGPRWASLVRRWTSAIASFCLGSVVPVAIFFAGESSPLTTLGTRAVPGRAKCANACAIDNPSRVASASNPFAEEAGLRLMKSKKLIGRLPFAQKRRKRPARDWAVSIRNQFPLADRTNAAQRRGLAVLWAGERCPPSTSLTKFAKFAPRVAAKPPSRTRSSLLASFWNLAERFNQALIGRAVVEIPCRSFGKSCSDA
jgi:hypothetical protein